MSDGMLCGKMGLGWSGGEWYKDCPLASKSLSFSIFQQHQQPPHLLNMASSQPAEYHDSTFINFNWLTTVCTCPAPKHCQVISMFICTACCSYHHVTPSNIVPFVRAVVNTGQMCVLSMDATMSHMMECN